MHNYMHCQIFGFTQTQFFNSLSDMGRDSFCQPFLPDFRQNNCLETLLQIDTVSNVAIQSRTK